jgi:tape measure domain-containing protein
MSGVQTSLALQDRLTGPLTRMMRAMDRTIGIMERMDRTANSVDTRGLQRARSEIQSAAADLERLRSSASGAAAGGLQMLQNQYTNLPGPINVASGAVRKFFAGFAGAAAAILSIQALKEGYQDFIRAADEYTSTSARLALINDGLQTQAELQEKVYQAAQRSLTPYNDLANSVAKLNLLASDAFTGGNDEAIRFSELMGKAFSLSNASTQERQAGMYQLTQAMAAGKLQGDEFRSIMENAPKLAEAISNSMGISKGALKELSSEGVITADIIKSSLFQAAEEIETQFNSLPLTFADAAVVFKNWASRSFEPLFVRFNQFVNSDAFDTLAGHAMWFVNIFTAGMGLMFDALEWFYGMVGRVGQFFNDNWAWIAPILTVIGASLGTIGLILVGLATKWALVSAATAVATAAQWAFDRAMYAFPGTWILLAFVAVISLVIYALINWANQTAAVLGFISGLFTTLITAIWNQFVLLWNFIAIFAEFLLNVFFDPVYAVKKLFYDMAKMTFDYMASMAGSFDNAANVLANVFVSGANIAIGAINGLIKALNMIPGVDIGEVSKVNPAAVSNLSSRLTNFANNLEAPAKGKNTVSIPRLEFNSLPDAFNAGNSFGQTLSNKMSSGLTKVADKISSVIKGPKGMDENPFKSTLGDSVLNSPGALKDAANPTGGKLDKVGKIDDEINISDEDIKLLRELAEIKSIQNFVTLTPTVQMQTGDIRNDVDVNKIISDIEEAMINEVARSAEGDFS